ncbi:hypothetical protein ILYODFUR_012863, partial [Ilyodon furcidens]
MCSQDTPEHNQEQNSSLGQKKPDTSHINKGKDGSDTLQIKKEDDGVCIMYGFTPAYLILQMSSQK